MEMQSSTPLRQHRHNPAPMPHHLAAATASAPERLTGCVSDISSCGAASHSYTHALRDYAMVYGAFQAYLEPAADAAPGRHGRAALEAEEPGGELPANLPPAPPALFSEEEIEDCGYLGWLQH